jgi:alkylresorcinol/alkylpyrone synthase/polyketide synthase Type III
VGTQKTASYPLVKISIQQEIVTAAATDQPLPGAQIIAVGTANSPHSYSQAEILEMFHVTDRRIRSTFLNGGIKRRFLTLPAADDNGIRPDENQSQLLDKHRTGGVRMGVDAIRNCLSSAGLELDQIAYLCCVTTTGLLTPGLSALVSKELNLPHSCGRVDIVGMGCNAGLNGLNVVNNWAIAHPGKVAVMLCVEVCSAAYVFDGTIQTSVVNSLFGDGAAAVALCANGGALGSAPQIRRFRSCLIPEAIDAMRFDWDSLHGKYNFFLDKDVPYVVGANAERVIGELLHDAGLRRSDIAHWIVHSGGKKVIDSVRINLGLSRHDLRHTTDVLASFGNLSSGSFLFSYQRLRVEGIAKPGDFGVCMTMGPGTTIETALVQW